MNDQQPDSTAKYMYDLSKGVALLAVVRPILEGELGPSFLIWLGTVLAFFAWGYVIQGGKDDDRT